MKYYSMRSVRRGMAVAVVSAALGPVAALAAEDFTRYGNEELVQLRNRAQSMDEADRLRYQAELQRRAQAMTPEERERLGIGGDQGPRDGDTRERTRANADNERGRGELNRERQRTESGSGYGRGYETRQGRGGAAGSGSGGRRH
jgi:hypothetical protein